MPSGRDDRRRYLLDQVQKVEIHRVGGRIPISIAGCRVDIVTSSHEIEARCREYFRNYLSSGGPAAEVFVASMPAPSVMPNIWEDEDAEFSAFGDMVIQRDFVARRLGSDSRRAVAIVAPGLDDAFHNLLRWFVSPILLENNAFLMHGAGAISRGKGYVFFGQSGAGKSTSMSLVMASDPHAVVVGDDAVIIQMAENGPLLHAAPLGCGYSRLAPPAATAPLRGLYSLGQHLSHRIENMPSASAVASLLGSVMVDMSGHSSDCAFEARLDLAERFAASRCGVKKLYFTKDAGFWNLVQKREEATNDEVRQKRERAQA